MENTNPSKSLLRNSMTGLVAAAALFAVACNSGNGPDDTPPPAELNRASLITMGDQVYTENCSGCHYPNGEGHSPHTPPLLHSDFLMASKERFVRIMLLGLPNEIDTATTITVNGVDYIDQAMGAFGAALSDTAMAALLTFLRVEFNDSSSVNCRAPKMDPDNNPIADCDLVVRPEAATDSVMPAEIAEYRALVPVPAE